MEARRQTESRSAEVSRKTHRNLVWEHRLLWVLMFAILLLWGYHYALGRVDRQLRGEIVKKLSERFPKHIIQLDRAHLEEGKAILLEGLEIAVPTSEGPRVVVRVQRVLVSGKLELLHLIQGVLPIQHVRVDGLEVSIWPLDKESWSIQSLSRGEAIPSNLPPIDIRSGLCRIGKSFQAGEETILHDLRGTLRLMGGTPTTEASSHQVVVGAGPPYLSIQASISSGHFRSIKSEAWLSLDKKQWALTGTVEDLTISDRFLASIPDPLRSTVASAHGLTCRSDAKFVFHGDRGTISYDVSGSFREGRLEHPQLPYRLEGLGGNVFCRNGFVQVRNVRANAREANFVLEADIDGITKPRKAIVRTQVSQLSLDGHLYRALPESLRATWDKLRVSGIVDATLQVEYDGIRWTPDATVHCRDVAVEADVFPYPVKRIQGDLRYHNHVVEGRQLTAQANGQSLRGALRLERASPRWLIDLQVASDGPVVIDAALISALTPRGSSQSGIERFVRSLQPSGSIQLNEARFVRSKENPNVLSKWIEIQLYNGAIQYAEFRYPIFDIQGQVIVDNDSLLLKELQGRHDSARIHCQGNCICSENRLDDLWLKFDAQSVPLQEGLQRALPSSIRDLWDQVQPSGVLDKVEVLITRKNLGQPLDLRVEIEEAGLIDAQTGSTVSLRPTLIPYLLNDISCHLVYRPGTLQIEMKGYHDFSKVMAEGTCRLREDGSWGCQLTWLPETRIIVDQSLLASLPQNLRQPLLSLDYRGPVNVGGSTMFVTDPATSEPKAESWNLELAVEDGKLSGGSVATGIRGTVFLEGVSTPTGPMAVGELLLDALAIRGVPVIGLEGKFAIVGDKLLMGREASSVALPNHQSNAIHNGVAIRDTGGVVQAGAVLMKDRNEKRPSRRLMTSPSQILPPVAPEQGKVAVNADDLRARALSGDLYLYGVGQLNTGRVSLHLRLENADFRNLLMDLGQTRTEVNGKLYVDAELSGKLQNIDTLSGGGIVRLREANLYTLPFMVRLISFLRVRAQDDGAFESADIRFGIEGERIPLEEIALDGDIISLRGDGWANLRREIHLDLYAYVGTRGQIAAMLGPLVGKNDNATFLRIEVDGTTDDPQPRRSFPGLETTLEQVFPNKVSKEPKLFRSPSG